MMPLRKNSTMIMMATENTTFRKPGRMIFSPGMKLEVSISKKRSHHSDAPMKIKELMQEPVTEPMPPMTTISKIS